MALSKRAKARIKWNKEHRLWLWKQSQQYGPTSRIFVHVRVSVNYNVNAARADEFGEHFFPVIFSDKALGILSDETLGA